MLFAYLFVLILQVKELNGFELPLRDNWLTNDTCVIRRLMVEEVREQTTCDFIKSRNTLCRRNVTVGYQDLPPYIYRNSNGEITGLLPYILEDILIHSCCFQCNSLIYENIIQNASQHQSFNVSQYDLLLPVENSENAEDFLEYPYVSLLSVDTILFIGKHKPSAGVNILQSMFNSLTKVWPIFVIAILMAICAGAIIWVFDTWQNKENFPRPFLRGSFEGFWWAFVSMTTVGYGDRTPNSILARLFAVVWILFGISLFNMFSAALISTMTSQLVSEADHSVFDQNVGVLKHIAAAYSALATEHARPVGYEGIENLKQALLNDEVRAIALESSVALFYINELKEQDNQIEILNTVKITNHGFGMVSTNQQIVNMMRSFMKHNVDSKAVIFAQAKAFNKQVYHATDFTDEDSSLDFAKIGVHFYYTLIIGAGIAVFCLTVGVLLSSYKEKHKKQKQGT